MNLSEEQKKNIRKRNENQSRRQDLKQHCQKILEGINKFDNNTSHRAIWELVQNARDLSDNSNIKITLDRNYLIFTHNGRPFDYDSFTSLIKQVSAEEKEDPNTAGQFGTGFMTTHKFSRKVIINGSMKITDDFFADVNNFVLDRSANELKSMIESMMEQLDYADNLLESEFTNQPKPETSFKYQLDDEHYPAAKEGIDGAFSLMPYVMVLNEKIEKVEIVDEEKKVLFVRKEKKLIDPETGLYELTVCCNIEEIKIYYLLDEISNSVIILPLKTLNEAMDIKDLPRFFLYFPLLGTQEFGLNFIFHNDFFYPEEPRNHIVLPEDNIDKREKYQSNVKILNSILDKLFQFLEKDLFNIENTKYIAPIQINLLKFQNSNSITLNFYENFKKNLVDKFLTLPFFKINGLPVSVSQKDKIRFLSPDIVNFLKVSDDKNHFEAVYSFASMVSNLPPKEEILEWSEIIDEWDTGDESHFIKIDDIVEKIIERDQKEGLHEFLCFLKDNGQTDYLRSKELIPNRDGKRFRVNDLRNANTIPSDLFDVIKYLIPKDTEKFVDEKLADIFEFPIFNRDDLRKSINEYVNSEKISSNPFKDNLPALLNYCSFFPIENGKSLRNKAMPLICELLNYEYKEIILSPLEGVDADTEQNLYRNAFDVLVNYVLNYIQIKNDESKLMENGDWYQKNKLLHLNLISSLCNPTRPTQYQTDIFKNFAIFPNQENKLIKPLDLKKIEDQDLNKENLDILLNLYDKVYPNSIKKQLVDPDYEWMFEFEKISPKRLASDIEDKLKEDQYQNPAIIEILDLLDQENENEFWKKLFDNIETNKPKIFLERLKGEQKKFAYTFMKAHEDNQKKIAELVDDPYFEIIIKKAKEIQENERDRKHMFDHMLNIGKVIEEKLREKLNSELLEFHYRNFEEPMEVNDIQNGQDIIIKFKGKIIYYIEVKSKWNFANPAHMSTNQMQQAVLNPDKYALCCIDLTQYSSAIADGIDIDTIVENTYVHLDIGKDLGYYLDKIVKDQNDNESTLKISDYQSNLNKGYFKKINHEVGIKPLIDDILTKIEAISANP